MTSSPVRRGQPPLIPLLTKEGSPDALRRDGVVGISIFEFRFSSCEFRPARSAHAG